MRFRTRLICAYSILVSALIIILGFFFARYSLGNLKRSAYQEMYILAENMSHQLDEIIRPMAFITEFLLSDSKTLSAITTLARAERTAQTAPYITQAKRDLQAALTTYCTDVNFHRVNFFSAEGDILSSNVRIHTIRDGAADTSLIPEIPRADAALGKPVILSPRPDPWTYVRAEPVFSIVRLIMGNTVPCYIEVQKTYRILDAVYNLRSDAIRVVVTDKNGGIFYSQLDRNGGRSPPGFRDSPGRAGKDITASYYSSYTGMYTFVIQNGAVIEKTFAYSAGMTLVSAVLVFLVSFAFIYILSVRITSPIRRLIENMERVTLDNMDLGVSFEPAHDEFERLRQSYNHFLKRLNRAIQQEKEMSLLHLQAEFDTLQAQVNPHFIYNVLNVISHRGVINGDETICEICEKLASMLRYSAGISRRTAAVREELEHLRHYLYLLKTRYQNKLEYAIDAGNSVMDQMIPKAVLQQLAENSVAHGFRNTLGIMTISVRGWTSGGCWYIEVRDNGQGFTDGEKAVLERKMEEIRKRIFEENLSLDMGGMGLINMYARFLILFGEGAVFRIANDGGAVVTIGASCTK